MTADTIDVGTGDLEVTLHGDGVAMIVLNRPKRMNALTFGLLDHLGRALATVEARPEARCILLTGAGRAFCAGGDVKSMAKGVERAANGKAKESRGSSKRPLGSVDDQKALQNAVVNRIWRMPEPIIASLSGPAVGAGLALALACDFRIASEQAALEMARKYAAGPTAIIGMMKRHVNLALTGDVDACLDLEVEDTIAGMKSRDHKEGIRALVEKRKPEFTGG